MVTPDASVNSSLTAPVNLTPDPEASIAPEIAVLNTVPEVSTVAPEKSLKNVDPEPSARSKVTSNVSRLIAAPLPALESSTFT